MKIMEKYPTVLFMYSKYVKFYYGEISEQRELDISSSDPVYGGIFESDDENSNYTLEELELPCMNLLVEVKQIKLAIESRIAFYQIASGRN
jgi:hypothetical protein